MTGGPQIFPGFVENKFFNFFWKHSGHVRTWYGIRIVSQLQNLVPIESHRAKPVSATQWWPFSSGNKDW
jgi:hypothetical protein